MATQVFYNDWWMRNTELTLTWKVSRKKIKIIIFICDPEMPIWRLWKYNPKQEKAIKTPSGKVKMRLAKIPFPFRIRVFTKSFWTMTISSRKPITEIIISTPKDYFLIFLSYRHFHLQNLVNVFLQFLEYLKSSYHHLF